ncbi:oligoendopeptidase F [Campylobacter sp. MIT 99-7217]|uniref:M3 family oligoendopeptidase n=1 Tax=Campylobacter sp. MIT 99-7217 TaxID=535091 RepID=UPI00115B0255|nr:M3 family oligoendopeptidase [Campylobacter sp. MIT 99-7217]TQR29342.1 oligoendopeptidase F [Campylobacter sp. MIT 99-7217]
MHKNEWNLKDLFEDEKALKLCLEKSIEQSLKFRRDYEGKLGLLDSSKFTKALKTYEQILQNISKIMSYVYLHFAGDTSKGGFLAKYENECKKAEENLIFFELEFCELDEEKSAEFIKNLSEYAFYLSNLLKNKKHNLTQKEERIMLYLSNTGANAFSRLFDENMSRLRVSFEGKSLSEEEMLSKLYNEDRKIRKKAAKKFSKALKANLDLNTYVFNMIKSERKIVCELRGYENAEESRHISNQITQKSVDALIKTTEKHFDLVSLFYKKKKQILGFKNLKDYDRYAPIGKEISVKYEQSKELVLKAFNAFSPEFANIAKKAFDERWIDVYPRENKRGGAFSHSTTPDAHPYIMLNFTGRHRDLFTLAHELGHTIHQKLSYSVNFLSQDTPLTTAETASVFAEMLVFDFVKDRLSKEELVGVYASKIEDVFATLYRQINFTTFERRIHEHKEELKSEQINEIWLEESKKMFGESVILTQNYELWWSYIPHFIHSPFYCYAYAYAQLLVLALYGLYKSKACENFTSLYIDLLKSGGSKSPKELISSFGFDIEDENFWELGIKEVEKLINEFMELKI